MKKRGKITLVLFFALAVALLAGGGWFVLEGREMFRKEEEIPGNLLGRAERRNIETKLLLTGEVEPAFSVEIKSEVGGKIEAIHVRTGDYAKRGAPLITIDDTDLLTEKSAAGTEIEGAELEVDKRRGNFERARALYEENLISKEVYANLEADLLIAKNSLVRAQARLQTVEDRLSKTRILAPNDGTVLNIPVSEGQVVVGAASVNAGTVLMNFASLDRLMIQTHINQMDVSKVKPGDFLYIKMQGGSDEMVPARIDFIAPVATVKNNIKGFAVHAIIEEEDERLRPGMSLRLEIPVDRAEETLSVPIAGVFAEEDAHVVYVRNGAHTERRLVEVGLTNFAFAEIKSGLREGDEVLLIQPRNLEDRG